LPEALPSRTRPLQQLQYGQQLLYAPDTTEAATTHGTGTTNAGQRVFDAHLHIIDPRFPLRANDGFLPDPFTVVDYRDRTKKLDIAGGAVVSGSFQGFDQSYLLAALRELGPGFVGVTQVPSSVSDAEILRLDAAGVRAVRFNLRRGGSAAVEQLEQLAWRIHSLAGWHVELYVDARELGELADTLQGLPSVSIDHLGLSAAGLPDLLRLAEHGVRVKATGFGRVDFDVPAALRALMAANPRSLMFGTDLPSTRAPRPFLDHDRDIIDEVLGRRAAQAVLFDNAWQFYHPGVPGPGGVRPQPTSA
jgi:predicted TIM-barrel fold metal-dependent hydrolase